MENKVGKRHKSSQVSEKNIFNSFFQLLLLQIRLLPSLPFGISVVPFYEALTTMSGDGKCKIQLTTDKEIAAAKKAGKPLVVIDGKTYIDRLIKSADGFAIQDEINSIEWNMK